MKQNLLDLNYEDLKFFLSEKIGVEEKKLNMRTQQIFNAVYQKGLNNFEKFTTIPIDLRKKLLNNISLNDSKIVETHESTDGTLKFLVEFFDGNKVECVYIPEKTRGTICVSSQVGCSLTCRFCRSGTQKLVKNLKASEIVSQVILVKDKLKDWGDQKIVSNIVFISSNDLASGPGVSSVGESGNIPSVGHTSFVVFKPAIPVKDAGILIKSDEVFVLQMHNY